MRTSVCVVLSLAFVCGIAAADPGAVTWSGGTVRLMAEHPSVSLVEETIVFEPNLTDTAVTVDLQFHNTGEARTVQMGFPTLKLGGPGYHFVRDFTVEADGAALPVTVQEDAQIELGGRSRDCVWHLFEVPFGADADLAMTVRYREHREHYWKMLRVPYVLATGASWQGEIRSVDLEVRLAERRNIGAVVLGVGVPIDATPHPEPLTLTQSGNVLRWRAEDYNGTPGVISLQAELGPGTVTDDAERHRRHYNAALAWWQDHRRASALLIEADYLADCLLATVAERSEDRVTLAKEGREVELAVTRLEGEFVPEGIELVDPAAALEAFGGAISTATEDDGDLAVTITTCPDSVASAQATALCAEQTLDYRRRALRRLAERWPEECAAVCEAIVARESEQAAVLAWAVGRLEAAGTPIEAPDALIERIEGDWRGELAEAILSATCDEELRGGVAMVPATSARSVGDRLVAGISECDDWQQGVPRGRNAGLALRLMQSPGARQAIEAAIAADGGHQPSEDAFVALGFLGDDAAIDMMVRTALDVDGAARDLQCAAAAAAGYLGTRAGMEACLDLWRRAEDREVQWRAWRGLEIACGTDHYRGHYSPGELPAWARGVSAAEARALCREWLTDLADEELDLSRAGDVARLARALDAADRA